MPPWPQPMPATSIVPTPPTFDRRLDRLDQLDGHVLPGLPSSRCVSLMCSAVPDGVVLQPFPMPTHPVLLPPATVADPKLLDCPPPGFGETVCPALDTKAANPPPTPNAPPPLPALFFTSPNQPRKELLVVLLNPRVAASRHACGVLRCGSVESERRSPTCTRGTRIWIRSDAM